MSDSDNVNFKEGDKVSWKYGSSKVYGEVAEIVEEGAAKVTSQKGNVITRNAKPNDPAVKLSREGNDAVKLAHELEPEK